MFWSLMITNKLSRFWLQAHRILKCGLLHLSRTYIVVMLWDIMRQGFLFSAFMGFSSIIFLSRYFCIFKGKFIFLRGFLQGDNSISNEPSILLVTLQYPRQQQMKLRFTSSKNINISRISTHPLAHIGIVMLWIKKVLVQLVFPAELRCVGGVFQTSIIDYKGMLESSESLVALKHRYPLLEANF